MPEQLIRLEEWARRIYGESAPPLKTLYKWTREAKIVPAPQKHGRSYFVAPNAVYMQPTNKRRARRRLVNRIDATETTRS